MLGVNSIKTMCTDVVYPGIAHRLFVLVTDRLEVLDKSFKSVK